MISDMFPEAHRPKLDENRRYTTRTFMHYIKGVAAVDAWDLDPAADAESHHARRWFSVTRERGSAGVNGLEQSWLPPAEWYETLDSRQVDAVQRVHRTHHLPHGINTWYEARTWRIFVNPPFDDLFPWVEKTWDAVEAASNHSGLFLRVGFVLPANRPEQPFWQKLVEPFRDGRSARFGYRLETHYPPSRQAYGHPGNPEGFGFGSPEFPSVVLVWRVA